MDVESKPALYAKAHFTYLKNFFYITRSKYSSNERLKPVHRPDTLANLILR